jgi:hypothetical protein
LQENRGFPEKSNSRAKNMHRIKLAAVLLGLGLWPNSGQAGLYNPAEPWENMLKPVPGSVGNRRPLDFFSSFALELGKLQTIGMAEVVNGNPTRLRYVLVADLLPRVAPAGWPTERKISLSGYLMRRGKYREAIDLLTLPAIRERTNFLVLANLGTAYHLEDRDMGRATDYLRQALLAWPRSLKELDKNMEALLKPMGWDEDTLLWYREAEKYHLKLVTLRAKELARPCGKPAETLDNLFDVDFKYEGDKLAPGVKAALPANALAIVQQLLIWLPNDPRLYWLLGELYHASGTPEDMAAARQILSDLGGFNGRYPVKGVRDHLHALGPAVPLQPNIPPPENPLPAKAPEDTSTLFDLRPLLIGFGAGVLVTLLAYWQLRELRRRAERSASGGRKPPD